MQLYQGEIIYEIVAIILAMFIVINYFASSFYGIRYFLCKKVKCEDDWIIGLFTGVSISWFALFVYILITTIKHNPPVRPDEFGALFIRPLILATGGAISVFQRRKYRQAKIYGGVPCPKQIRK